MSDRSLRIPLILVGMLPASAAMADYKDEIGYTALKAELGVAMPTGAGVGVSMAEAPWEGGSENYAPDPAQPEFAGKTITRKSGSATVSIHATVVGQYLFGSPTSIAPGVNTIDSYSSSGWRGNSLNSGSFSAPDVETRQVQNHSWISSTPSSAQDVLRRLDYAINRDGFTATVGVANWDLSGSAPAHPRWLSNAYNAIAVGLTSDTVADTPRWMMPGGSSRTSWRHRAR